MERSSVILAAMDTTRAWPFPKPMPSANNTQEFTSDPLSRYSRIVVAS